MPMPHHLRALSLLLAATMAPFVAPLLQDPKPAPAAQGGPKMSDADKEKKVRELLQLTNADDLGGEMMKEMEAAFGQMRTLPEGFVAKFREFAKPEDFVELMVPVYMKHVEATDLDTILGFFRSEAGKRWVNLQKPVISDSKAVGQVWRRDLTQKTLKALEADEARKKEQKKD